MNTIIVLSVSSVILLFVIVSLLFINIYAEVIVEHTRPHNLMTSNKSSSGETAVLYGKNKFLLTPNFGSGKGIVIEGDCGVSYLEHLANSGTTPFQSRLIRLRGMIDILSNTIITINSFDVGGQSAHIPVFVSGYIPLKIAHQDLTKEVEIDMPYPVNIDGNVHLSYTMMPDSKVGISIFYNTSKFKKVRLYRYILSKIFRYKLIDKEKSNYKYDHPLFEGINE